MAEIRLSGIRDYTVEFSAGAHTVAATVTTERGVDILKVTLDSECAAAPAPFIVKWEMPCIDIHGKWHPRCAFDRGVYDSFELESSLLYGAPVVSLYSLGGTNRFTCGLSDSVNRIEYSFERERDMSLWKCSISHFEYTSEPVTRYECTYRFDYRDVRFEDAVADVSAWWSEMDSGGEAECPDLCRSPIYSDELVLGGDISGAVEACLPYRIKSVIGKDKNVSDMKLLVEKIHGMGLKYFLDVGSVAVVNDSMAEKTISDIETAVEEWDIDGIRLGLSSVISVEEYNAIRGEKLGPFDDVIDRFLKNLSDKLTALKPDFGIKIYGNGISPKLWKYGMFHMPECSGDPVSQRVRTLDLRLLGVPAPHSDTIIWNKDDSVASAVLQFVGTMFAVPQISVRPENLPEEQHRMLYDWLWFWERNRDVLLNGRLRVESAENLYTSASVEKDGWYIAAKFASNAVISAPEGRPRNVIVVNGSPSEDVFIQMPRGRGHYYGAVWNCMGEEIGRYGAACGELVHVKMPAGARIEFNLA